MKDGKRMVLLVDDEEFLLEVEKLMLEELGCVAYVAEDGQKALALCKENQFDLVLLDMNMPNGMSGEETFYCLRGINPELQILISSGYALDSKVQKMMNCGCRGFLQKPFRLDDLSEKIREVLDL